MSRTPKQVVENYRNACNKLRRELLIAMKDDKLTYKIAKDKLGQLDLGKHKLRLSWHNLDSKILTDPNENVYDGRKLGAMSLTDVDAFTKTLEMSKKIAIGRMAPGTRIGKAFDKAIKDHEILRQKASRDYLKAQIDEIANELFSKYRGNLDIITPIERIKTLNSESVATFTDAAEAFEHIKPLTKVALKTNEAVRDRDLVLFIDLSERWLLDHVVRPKKQTKLEKRLAIVNDTMSLVAFGCVIAATALMFIPGAQPVAILMYVVAGSVAMRYLTDMTYKIFKHLKHGVPITSNLIKSTFITSISMVIFAATPMILAYKSMIDGASHYMKIAKDFKLVHLIKTLSDGVKKITQMSINLFKRSFGKSTKAVDKIPQAQQAAEIKQLLIPPAAAQKQQILDESRDMGAQPSVIKQEIERAIKPSPSKPINIPKRNASSHSSGLFKKARDSEQIANAAPNEDKTPTLD